MNSDCSICDPQGNPFPGEQLVGLYEGAHYYHCDAYRPVFSCMMRNFAPFCPVCTKAILDTLEPFQPENSAPVCDAGGPYVAECTGTSTEVSFDGSGSSDPDCNLLTFEWSNGFTEGTASGSTPTVHYAGVGVSNVDLTVSDGSDSDSCSASVTIQDTTPPSITAPADVSEECSGPEGAVVAIGSATASDSCDGSPVVSNDAPAVFPIGDTVVTWTATDASGNQSTDTQTVSVVDTTPPTLSVSLSPTTLWPPNHKLVDIEASIEVSDVCDPNPTVVLASIISSEPDNDISDGNTDNDIQGAEIGTDDRAFQLRAERRGKGSGREYLVSYEASDASANTTTESATVLAPHNQ